MVSIETDVEQSATVWNRSKFLLHLKGFLRLMARRLEVVEMVLNRIAEKIVNRATALMRRPQAEEFQVADEVVDLLPTPKRAYAALREARIAEIQRAFERARRGGGLFGLKDAEQRS